MNIQIGLPCTPAYFNKDTEFFTGYEITISYGGGMGGASRSLYVREMPDIDNKNGLINVNTIFDEEYILNRNYIAFMKKVGIIVTDVHTNNSCWIKNGCRDFKTYYTFDCAENSEHDIVVVNNYVDSSKTRAKVIKNAYYKD